MMPVDTNNGMGHAAIAFVLSSMMALVIHLTVPPTRSGDSRATVAPDVMLLPCDTYGEREQGDRDRLAETMETGEWDVIGFIPPTGGGKTATIVLRRRAVSE